MANSTKELYLCEDLDELQQKFNPQMLDNVSAELIIGDADRLYPGAEKATLAGDEELAYIYYFRYVNAIATARKKRDYKKDYDKLVPGRKFKNAIETLEQLTDSLTRRYKLRNELKKRLSLDRNDEYDTNCQNEGRSEIRSATPVSTASSYNATSTRMGSTIVPVVFSPIKSETNQKRVGGANSQCDFRENVDYPTLKGEDKNFTYDNKQLNTASASKFGDNDHDHVRNYSCFECPICFEIPRGRKIFQCRNGHMICECCSERVTKCPQCNCALTGEDRIRNLVMENVFQAMHL